MLWPDEEEGVAESGLSLDELPGIYREEYLYGVEVARAQHDPCVEWEAFTDVLWNCLAGAFGLDAVATSEDASHAHHPRGR
jgi:hypothetical protein